MVYQNRLTSFDWHLPEKQIVGNRQPRDNRILPIHRWSLRRVVFFLFLFLSAPIGFKIFDFLRRAAQSF